jgi:phage terminase large subunit-like protein
MRIAACTVWGYDGRAWLLLDVVRQRLTFSDLLARARLERSRWRADRILIENCSAGLGLKDDLRRDMRGLSEPQNNATYCTTLAIRPDGPKQERFYASVERLYTGFAKLPREAPWLEDSVTN